MRKTPLKGRERKSNGDVPKISGKDVNGNLSMSSRLSICGVQTFANFSR